MAQPVVVIEIFVSQRDPIDPLTYQRLQTVFDSLRITVVAKTASPPLAATIHPHLN
jgi:hypothetical protein